MHHWKRGVTIPHLGDYRIQIVGLEAYETFSRLQLDTVGTQVTNHWFTLRESFYEDRCGARKPQA